MEKTTRLDRGKARQVPHTIGAVLRTPPADLPLSPAAQAFVPAERDPYDNYVEPDDVIRALAARVTAAGSVA